MKQREYAICLIDLKVFICLHDKVTKIKAQQFKSVVLSSFLEIEFESFDGITIRKGIIVISSNGAHMYTINIWVLNRKRRFHYLTLTRGYR